ncbi:MAG: hypothetical protein K0S70_663 [Microbacterium sp.]|jgi:hypothetical protein|nr:hypothetical protein [Microbacterium sp.]
MRRRREQAARELETGITWLDGCPPAVGAEVAAAVAELTNVAYRVYQRADRRLGNTTSYDWVSEKRLNGEGDDIERLDAVAAVIGAFVWLAENDEEWEDSGYSNRDNYEPEYDAEKFIEVVNDRLLYARVDWSFEDGQFQERGNFVLHSEVLRPATILLADDPAFVQASAAFQSALTKLSKGETEVALTEAATSLQEFFRALGVDGNSLSNQLDNAANAKVISGADRSLMKPLLDWVNADRSNRGNAHYHRTGDVSKADAWLMMHVVGAVMVRLSNREPRDIVAAREKREADAVAAKAEQERIERAAAEAAAAAREPDPWEQPGQYGDDTPF